MYKPGELISIDTLTEEGFKRTRYKCFDHPDMPVYVEWIKYRNSATKETYEVKRYTGIKDNTVEICSYSRRMA